MRRQCRRPFPALRSVSADDLAEGCELEEGFLEEAGDQDNEDVGKAQSVKNLLAKRRQLDDVLDERRLRRQLRDYDFDLDE